MPSISLKAFRESQQQAIQQMDASAKAQGYIRLPGQNGYVRDPSFQTPTEAAKEQIGLQQATKNLEQDSPDYQNQKTLESLLTPDEASQFGVNYGAKKKDIVGKPVPQKKNRTSTADLEEKTYNAIRGFTNQLSQEFTPQGDLSGVGFGTGSVTDLLYQLGINKDKKGSSNRIAIANIQSTLAKLRAGTSFTPNEEKLLKKYTPTENDSPAKIKDKLDGLTNYLRYRTEVAGGEIGQTTNQAQPPTSQTTSVAPQGGRFTIQEVK